MSSTTVLTLVDGVLVVVPDSLDLITPYVLREQLDFFEDELRFARDLLRPGQKVVDIGANYGVYTLPMAKRVGAHGHVWAFEPATNTAHCLEQGIAANGFTQVTLERRAVSSETGSGQLLLNRHSELNSLSHGEVSSGTSESVELVTLDDCMDRYQWTEIEFIKIDAEGEEDNIVKGGRRFLANISPLVQYELRTTATDMNFGLIQTFASLGYDSYRLLPGLNVLVPFSAESRPDPYLLNLFCCKADRADWLASRGLLIRAEGSASVPKDAMVRPRPEASYHWRQTLAHLPYAAPLAATWEKAEGAGDSAEVVQGLTDYARSRDSALSIVERFEALDASFLRYKAICERNPARLRLASLARIAHDYGERAVTISALNQLLGALRLTGVDSAEPFIAPLERFDSIAPGEALDSWLVGAILEQLERRERFSSFYAGPGARERLEDIDALGFGSAEMRRRLELVRLRFDGPPRL